MREKQNNWQRIEAVILWANMSTNYFARHIGLARGENLYQIKKGNNGVSLDVADRIVAKFPNIDKLWLLTGEGEMFVNSRTRGAQIPFFNIDIVQGLPNIDKLTADQQLLIPLAGDADFAMRYQSGDMGEKLPVGSVVILKAVEIDAIIPGSEYVIVSQKIVTLRIVRACNKVGYWRLVAGDKLNFDDIIMDASKIGALYKVKCKLIINN